MPKWLKRQAAYVAEVAFWSLYVGCWLFLLIAALPLICLSGIVRARINDQSVHGADRPVVPTTPDPLAQQESAPNPGPVIA
jgi:hypothetical protein